MPPSGVSAEALAEQQRRERHRHDRLSHEHHRRHLDRRARLQGARLAEHAHGGGRRGRQAPGGRREQDGRGRGRRRRAWWRPRSSRTRAPRRSSSSTPASGAAPAARRAAGCAAPSPASTSVIVRCSGGARVVRGGAHSPAPITPSTIAAHRQVLVRPACSPSMRWAKNISTSRPAASAGCTTTSGASSSATTCSGQPRIDRPVPSSQRRAEQVAGERQAQVLLVGRLLGVHRLQRDP